jgi:hypothetical protein
MATTTLDINDASLSLWQEQGPLLRSTGYALLEGSNYSFGEAARSQARLHPQQVNHRFWSQLNVEPLTPAFGPGRHSADLVHAHLLEIHGQCGEPEQLMITAPASLQHDQLALLLGIIEQCPFRATGLVDRAVAAAASCAVSSYNWHIELQLHQSLVTGIRCADGILSRDRVVPIPASGWLALQDSLVKAIADAFIRQTRFDPRRKAATEQALYDQLPTLLEKLQVAAEYNMELGGHQARVERSLLAASCDRHYQRIHRALEAESGQILLGPSLVCLPEIDRQFPAAVAVPEAAIYQSIANNLAAIEGDAEGLHFITTLPAPAGATAAEPPTASVVPPPEPAPEAEAEPEPEPEPYAPSHCLIDIRDSVLTLQHHSGPPPLINGEVVTDSQRLAEDDLIQLENGTAWRLTRVDGDNGSQT